MERQIPGAIRTDRESAGARHNDASDRVDMHVEVYASKIAIWANTEGTSRWTDLGTTVSGNTHAPKKQAPHALSGCWSIRFGVGHVVPLDRIQRTSVTLFHGGRQKFRQP